MWISGEPGGCRCRNRVKDRGEQVRRQEVQPLGTHRGSSDAEGLSPEQGLVSWWCEQVQLAGEQETRRTLQRLVTVWWVLMWNP